MNTDVGFMHEIKNCLSNIYALSDMIDNDPKETITLIKESIEQIKNIEQDYDIYTKTGTVPVVKLPIGMGRLLSSIIAEYSDQAAEKNITIKTDYKNLRVISDQTKLRQILSNLISNAIKYNKPNGSVLIEFKKYTSKFVICVYDTGIGMTPAEIAKLGQPFFRCKKVDVPGTGLGWSIVKQLVDVLGGQITVDVKDLKNVKDPIGTTYTTKITFIHPI